MEKPLLLCGLFLGLDIFEECSGFPVDLHSRGLRNAELWTSAAPFLAVAVLLCFVVLLAGCLCCRQTKGFQEFTDSTSSHSLSGTGGYVNNAASTTEFTIFPPLPANIQQQRLSVAGQTPGDRSSVVRFEPLPDIKPPQPISRRPAAFNNAVSHGLSAQDWFEDPHANFPRHQLKYLRELGRGWFGRAVEGEAQGIVPGEKTSKVVVKILHEDATATDHMYFLHEVKPYRDLKHPNILKLLGRCLETDPFLVLLEACPSGDLKSFLSQNISTAEALSQQGVTLLMGCNIASGLQHMHQNGFVHTDLAARNCLVTSDLTVKIGDYGTSIETFKDDYYCAGEVALPIRWCAPETLFCTETTIETKEVTPGANVWNLGVVLWEICEFGKLPYSELTDDEVIVKVLGEGNHRLSLPSRSCLHRHNLYHLMRLCWSPASQRPALPQVLAMLNHLYTNREYANQDGDDVYNLKADEDFERRWETFKPNTIPKTDNHLVTNSVSVLQSPIKEASSAIPPVLVADNLEAEGGKEDKFLNEPKKLFILSQPTFDSMMISPQDTSNTISDVNSITPLTTSPQPSLTSSTGGEFFLPTLQHRHKSPSLQNLRGSLDDLCECNGELNEVVEGSAELSSEVSEALKERQKRKSIDNVVVEEEANNAKMSVLDVRLQEESIGTLISEPEFDSWLQGVETTDEEDAKFVRKISEAIRDLDNALALEKTSSSSSSSEASSNSASHHQSPAKEVTPITSDQNVVLDFRLGPSSSHALSGVFSCKEVTFQPDSLQDDSLLERSLPREGNRATDSGTDTEDEMWRRRIECGEFSAKVKEKSKSVADLMVLTHIECSDGSDSDPPSPSWGLERNLNSRDSFSKQRRGSSNKTYNLNTSSGLAFGSESNIHHAVLGEEFRHTLLKLHEALKDIKNVNSVQHQDAFENDPLLPQENSVFHSSNPKSIIFPSHHHQKSDFLDIDASEIPKPTPEKVFCQSVSSEVLSLQNDRCISEDLLGSEHDNICVVTSNEIEDRSQVPEVEIFVKEVVKLSDQEVKSVCDERNMGDCVRKEVCVEDLNENISVCVKNLDESVHSNIPFSDLLEPSSSLSETENGRQEQILISDSVSQNDVVESALSPTAEDDSTEGIQGNQEVSCTSESVSCSDISLFVPSDIFSELNDSELIDSSDIVNILESSPVKDNIFSPLPQHTSTPQNGSILYNNNTYRSEEASCVHRNLEFEEPMSKIISDHDETQFSLSSIKPLDSSVGSFSDSSKAQTSTNFGTSTDSFDFITHPDSKDSKNESFSDPPAPRMELTKANLLTHAFEESKPLSSERDEPEASVILGPCEDYTLDYFKGLKTTSEDNSLKVFDSEETNPELSECDIPEIVENDFHEERINNPKLLVDENYDFSHDIIPNIDNKSLIETHTSSPLQTSISSLENSNGNDNLPLNEKSLTCSFLENEIREESFCREHKPVENLSIPNTIFVEAESISVDSQEETTGKLLTEELPINGDVVLQDRLKSVNSDLCVPNLNFIAATPLPSGRNSPELVVENGNDYVEIESMPTEVSPVINGETSVMLNNLSEFCSNAGAVREEPSVQPRISSELNVEELSAPAATDVHDVESPVSEKAVNVSCSSEVEPSFTGKSDMPVVASTSSDSSSHFNERNSLLNDSSNVILSHPAKETDDFKNIEILENEEFVHRLISSLSDLSIESKSLEAAPGINEMDHLSGNVMQSKHEYCSSNEVQLSEDLLSPVDDNTKDSTSEIVSESMSTVKSNLFECDTVQNSPDIVEGHVLSLVPEEITVDEVPVEINSVLNEEKQCEDKTIDPLSFIESNIIDQAVMKEAAILVNSDTNLTVQSNLLQLNENLAVKTCNVSFSSGSNEKIEVLSTKVNVQSVEPTLKCTEGDLGMLQLLVESPSGAKEHEDLLPVLKEQSVNEITSEGMECVVQEKNSSMNKSNSGENNPALNETGSSQNMISNLNSSVHNIDKISSSCIETDMNKFCTSPLLNETVAQNFKTDDNKIVTVVSPTLKELPPKDVSDLSNTAMPLSLHKIEEPNLPINLTSVVTLPFKQPDFEDNSLIDEKLKVCPESKQFCFTEAMDVFVKDIPGKTDDAVEKWKQQNIEILAEDFFQTSLDGKQYANKVLPVATDIGSHDFSSRFQIEESETAVELDDDGEDFGLDVAKHSTPDDERSSDSGFRDKGSLSESCEDACDEKYNLEDIEAELEETFNKGGFNYVVKGIDGEEDDLDHHHGGTDTSEDFRQSETPDGELDSTSSPIGMCGKLSPINQVDSPFCSGQKDKQVAPDHFAEMTVQDTSDEFDSESPLQKPNTHSLSVSNMNVLNSKSVYVDKISSSSPRRHHTPETPDLLNIEASDIPMPDLTVDQRKGIDDRYNISSPDDKTVPAKHKQSDLNSNCHTHSSFSEEKDLILDIGQTEFRAFSPEHNTNSFLNNSDLSPIRHMGGWFLHPPHFAAEKDEAKLSSEENHTLGDLMDDVFMSPKSSSSSISNGSKSDENNCNENNYVPFNLDEEFVAAIRNELQEKLPCARQHSHDEPEDDGVIDPEDDLSQEERTDITIHYNVYPPPLSPILEERESVSSITTTISDNFCPFIQTAKETSKQDSDSEPASPVFFLDSTDPCEKEAEAQRFEQEIREALENCSLSSAETDSSSDKGQQKSSVLVEDLEQPSSDQVDVKHPSSSVTVVRDTFQQPDFDDDFLVVDTETNHATLLESPKPKSYLAFVNKRPLINGTTKETAQPADFLDEKLTVSESSDGSFFLHAKKSSDLNAESENVKISPDDEAFTPDSISPGQERQVPSSNSPASSDGDNPSGNLVTPNDPFNTRLDLGLQIPAAYNPFFANSLATLYDTSEVPTYDVVEEISLGLPNNEAAEIISELESSGIFNNVGKESVQNDYSNETGEESSRTTTENDSEAISLEENSDSLKSGCSMSVHQEKKSLSLVIPSMKQYSEQNDLEDSCSQADNLQLSSVSIELEESIDEANGPTRLLNDTLDLYKKKKASQKNDLSPTAEDKDWSVTSLEAALLSTKAPMPSPEEESWKQIPSMLAFSDLNEVISRCGNEEGFGEAMFASSSSPTYPPQENDDDLMSTSFSLKGDSDDLADCYTPDWESESEDTNDDDNNSSSSGEFIWKDGDREASVKAVDISSSNSTSKPYEGLTDFAMEVIAEEEEEEEDEDEDGSTSSGSGTEFVPSAWNSEATPNRSALRSPDKKVDQKKNVSFKKQKYHCVYEYPREVSDSESDGLDSPSRRRWELYQPDVDYASYADWELMEGDVPEAANQDADPEPEVPESQGQSPQTFDFYKLSDVDYDFSTGVMPEDGEFYVSSSARPFQFNAADSDIFCNNSSQFFPGQLYQATNVEDCSTNTTATSVQSKMSTLGVSVDSYEDEVDTSLPAVSNLNKSSAMVGNQNSKAKGEKDVQANIAENKPSSPKHIKEVSFKNLTDEHTEVSNSDNSDGIEHSSLLATNDRAKMAVSTVALTSRLNTLPLSYNAGEVKSLATCVTVDNNVEKELDFVETPSPSSPLSPTSGLGELRHTRDRLKLDLPASGSAFILDPPALSKRRSVEAVKGEASLLDSGEETEDSGIESSNGTTASSLKSQHTQVL
ncbi:uncharacterized protein [Anabrus simplex]|uniref:uncharacterized protein n=1 Tax=Anabrus simplex TaxID=316456 RepID=UPI0035A29FB0